MKIGILLINLGTPASCNPKDVKNFLHEFLMDPFVIDIPWLARKIFVDGFIIPFRLKNTTEAYKQIWTEKGSPLAYNTYLIQEKLQKIAGESFIVKTAMRYGTPNIQETLNELRFCSKIIIFPLYPQFALATSSSTLNQLFKIFLKENTTPSFSITTNFYSKNFYINAYSQLIKEKIGQNYFDHLLFSYHSIPKKQNNKISHCKKICTEINSCPPVNHLNNYCYRAQCFTTSQLIANSLKLKSNQYSTSFQSRLGKTPWLEPYTDIHIEYLIEKKIKHLVIACPSFICDCLETLEEIGIRLKEKWLKLGGESFFLIPCLNDNDLWINNLHQEIKKNLSEERLENYD